MSPLSKDETHRDGSNLFIVIKLLFIFWTMSQVLLSWTPLTEFGINKYIFISILI